MQRRDPKEAQTTEGSEALQRFVRMRMDAEREHRGEPLWWRVLYGPDRLQYLIPVLIVIGWIAGIAAVQGGTRGLLVRVLAVVAVAVPVGWIFLAGRVRPGFLQAEVPIFLLLLSGIVLRQRDAEALSSNPLDPAGSYRLLCVAAALALGVLALTSPRNETMAEHVTTRPFRFYIAYVVVVFIGAIPSVNPFLTAFRGLELLTGVVVIAGAYRTVGHAAIGRILQLLYWWTIAMAISVWLGILLFPGEGMVRIASPLPWQIKGVLPVISSNGVGTIGSLLVIWSVGLLVSRNEDMPTPGRVKLVILLGAVTLILAQYRTGYVATAFGLLVLLALRKRGTAVWVLVAAIAIAGIWGSSFLEAAEPYALRGQTVDRAAQLSGRINWWSAALPVWRENPVIGAGLLTGTRFEVLAEIGRTQTSTIHGTWIEALVGTGLVGIALLISAFVTTARRAVAEALRPTGRLIPALLVALLFVRGLTGSTFEAFGSFALIFGAIAMSLRDHPSEVPPDGLLAPSRI